MKLYYLSFLLLSILSTSFGQLFYKIYVNNVKKKYLFFALALFALAPILILMALSGLPMDVVFMSDAITVALVVVLSVTVLGERITLRDTLAVLMIISGIAIYNIE